MTAVSKLHSFWRSSASYRIRIVLNLKDIEYESVTVNLRERDHRSTDYLAANPQGLVPMLQEGDWYLGQSLAIAEYLDETYLNPPLLPREPRQKAEVRALAQVVCCDIHPLNNLRTLNYLRDQLGQSDASVGAWYCHWVNASFEALEAMLVKSAGAFCYGDQVSLADVCLVPQVYNARRFNADLNPYPTLERLDAYLNSLPAFADAAPENQPDAK